MISSPRASRKAVDLRAGDPPPTAPPTQSPASTTAIPAVSPFFTGPFPLPRAQIHLYRPAESFLASFPATVDALKSP